MNTHKQLLERITNYLSNGGLFNPEYMNHQEVQRLLIDIRDYLNQPPVSTFPVIPNTSWGACPVCNIQGINGLVCNNMNCPTKVICT